MPGQLSCRRVSERAGNRSAPRQPALQRLGRIGREGQDRASTTHRNQSAIHYRGCLRSRSISYHEVTRSSEALVDDLAEDRRATPHRPQGCRSVGCRDQRVCWWRHARRECKSRQAAIRQGTAQGVNPDRSRSVPRSRRASCRATSGRAPARCHPPARYRDAGGVFTRLTIANSMHYHQEESGS